MPLREPPGGYIFFGTTTGLCCFPSLLRTRRMCIIKVYRSDIVERDKTLTVSITYEYSRYGSYSRSLCSMIFQNVFLWTILSSASKR